MYDKVSTNLNFVDREKEILGFWKQNDIFGESIKARENCPVFTFYEIPMIQISSLFLSDFL